MISSPSAASHTKPAVPAAIRVRGLVRPSEVHRPSSSGSASGHSQGAPANSAGGEIRSSRPYHGRISNAATPAASQRAIKRGGFWIVMVRAESRGGAAGVRGRARGSPEEGTRKKARWGYNYSPPLAGGGWGEGAVPSVRARGQP